VKILSFTDKFFITKIETKKASVIMRATEILSIFTTHIKPDWLLGMLTQPLHKILKMFVVKRHVLWDMIFVICERDKAVVFMELCFMYTAYCPLA
jgi:hypothetical protein